MQIIVATVPRKVVQQEAMPMERERILKHEPVEIETDHAFILSV
jgi:hypothetical protein